MKFGAVVEDRGTRFRVWAPKPRAVELVIVSPREQRLPMRDAGEGWREALVDGVGAGARYGYSLDGGPLRPDPASRAQPDGVHAASAVVDPRAFVWRHPRRPRSMRALVIYELHVGTFTRAGTFDDAAAELDRLVDLGVTAVELMPVASFSGARNWGYDGVGWFAPQQSYGGPDGLARFVDAAHARGLTVVLDVVYNHFGPEGNYIGEYAPFFTSRHKTPWGDAIDYANPSVRAFILENARQWLDDYRLDGLRLDAVHAIADDSPRHIVLELAQMCRERDARCIAESDLGDVRVIREPPDGWGCDAQWSDDFHHALHAVVTGESSGYYEDFGTVEQLARAVREGFVYQGERSRHRGRAHGTPSRDLPGQRFVICAQNHDQIGNRAAGERLAHLAPGCEWAVAATVLLAPSVPLLFMGEEHADPAPFQYFTDHQDAALAQAVRDGRRREFPSWRPGDVPDPQAAATRDRSVIDLSRGERSPLRRWYRALLELRRERLAAFDKARVATIVDEESGGFAMIHGGALAIAVSLRGRPTTLTLPRGDWRVVLDAGAFGGPTGAQLDGDKVRLPAWGGLVIESRA